MLNNISLNNYVDRKTFIYKLNTICKLISLFLFLLITLNTENIYIHISYLIYLFFLILISKILIKDYLKSIKHVLYLLIGIFIINIIFQTTFLENAINIFKIIEIVIYTSIITMTTSESEMINGISTILKPLKIFKININKLAFIFTFTIRFIPIIIDQINIILKTLLSRGINTKKNKLIILKSIIIPTFNLSIKKADNLADSMEVRMYDINNEKTNYTYNKWSIKDTLIMIIYISILIIVLGVKI